MSLSFLRAAAEAPEEIALIAGGTAYSFAALAPRVRRIAAWLARDGLGPRSAALVADQRVDSLLALYALIELGAPAVIVHPRLTADERAALIDRAAPALVLDESWSERDADATGEAPPAPPVPDDARPLAVLFTSGTSGPAKAAVLSRAAFAASARASAAHLRWRGDDRWLLSVPLAHVGGLSIVTRCLAARRPLVLADPQPGGRFDADAIAAGIARDRITLLSLVPTMLRRLFDLPAWAPPPELRAVLLGGAAASPHLLDEAAARDIPVLTTYGLTEACSQVTVQSYGTRPGAEHGAGLPLAGVEVRIADDEIHVRGPNLLSGYLAAPGETAASPLDRDGWFATGDFGRFDERGRLHLLARRTDLIVTGGENVYPMEVEAALARLAGIAGCCVFATPDETWGQRVAVAIAPAASGPPTDAELDRFFRTHLAPHKRPREVAFIDELPTTPSGKLDRAAAASLARAQLRALKPSPS